MTGGRESWADALSAGELDCVRALVVCGGDVARVAECIGQPVGTVRRNLEQIGARIAAIADPEPNEWEAAAVVAGELAADFPAGVAARIAEIYRRVVDERP